MPYQYFVVAEDMFTAYGMPLRTALFQRMQKENLLHVTMYAYENPSLEHWLEITQSQRGWLLCCAKGNVKGSEGYHLDNIQAMAFLAPLPWGQGNKGHRVWTFDFTVFRAHFKEAVAMSQGALAWIFSHVPCDSLLGLCAQSNRHAWRLSESAGFQILGHIPGACLVGKKGSYEAAILVIATRLGVQNSLSTSIASA